MEKPIFMQAPMDGVSDFVFREMLLGLKACPHVFFTEFTSLKELIANNNEAYRRLKIAGDKVPTVAQVWSKTPEDYYKGALLISKMGFNGIDINMGCPSKKMIKKGCCSAFILDKIKATECISALKEGSGEGITVSLKTRIGFHDPDESWLEFILEQDMDFITLHARTVNQMSFGEPRWEYVKLLVNMRNKAQKKTLIFGNGDVSSISQAHKLIENNLCDGVMMGRALVKNPFLFFEENMVDKSEILKFLSDYLQKFIDFYNRNRNFEELKKIIKYNMKNFERNEVLSVITAKTQDECLESLAKLLEKYET